MRHFSSVLLIALAAIALPSHALHAQGITLAPMFGAYTQASSFASLRSNAQELRVERETALALGLNVEFGAVRGSLAYVSGATLNEKGASNTTEIGEGTLIAGAIDLLIRPVARIVIFQPYLFIGGGFKDQQYSYTEDRFSAFGESDRDLAIHAGIGADLMFGGIGVVAEISDFLSKDFGGSWNQHDGFGLIGVKVRM
jgi:hypothetical protein